MKIPRFKVEKNKQNQKLPEWVGINVFLDIWRSQGSNKQIRSRIWPSGYLHKQFTFVEIGNMPKAGKVKRYGYYFHPWVEKLLPRKISQRAISFNLESIAREKLLLELGLLRKREN